MGNCEHNEREGEMETWSGEWSVIKLIIPLYTVLRQGPELASHWLM